MASTGVVSHRKVKQTKKICKCPEGAIDSQKEDYQKEGDSLFSKERIPISLFFKEQQERIAHGRFFVKSEERLQERFTLRHKKGGNCEKLSTSFQANGSFFESNTVLLN